MPTPQERYHQDLQKPEFTADPAQAKVVAHLQQVYDALLVNQKSANRGLLQALFGKKRSENQSSVKGLYLWGGVGRGKTYLMDVFYECLPFENKLRSHFHRFMRNIHSQLQEFKGQADPLDRVASRIAARARVICFDEFFVSDITDAMLLGNLLKGLFARGVTLVATSNVEPNRLYENGLQRRNFLPAIDLINHHTQVIHLDSATDYRLRALDQAELYYCPSGENADQSLQRSFDALAPMEIQHGEQLEEGEIQINQRGELAILVEGRLIPIRKVADDVIWFEFAAICDGPRSQSDYIELAMEYHAVLISDVPVFYDTNNDQARRFINLVDVFYDRNIKLVLSAAAELRDLYQGRDLKFEFARTVSRLVEMQSHEYLARPHRP